MTTSPAIRVARPDELDLLRSIEVAADGMFADLGFAPFATDDVDHLADATLVLVAGDPPVGFASVGLVDGSAFLRQLSVDPGLGSQGVGTALVEAVCSWAAAEGLPSVTLTTFRDVPWNAPFYARRGFVEVVDLSPGLAAVREHERRLGDDGLGPRVAMRRML